MPLNLKAMGFTGKWQNVSNISEAYRQFVKLAPLHFAVGSNGPQGGAFEVPGVSYRPQIRDSRAILQTLLH